jgi:hypothetical protein
LFLTFGATGWAHQVPLVTDVATSGDAYVFVAEYRVVTADGGPATALAES